MMMKTVLFSRALVLLALAALAGCRAPGPLKSRDWVSPLETVMTLYSPANTMDEYVPVAVRHRRVEELYSQRVNALFAKWEALDRQFQRLKGKDGHLLTSASGSAAWWGAFTAPVAGCSGMPDTLRFSTPDKGTPNDGPWDAVRMEYTGSGPQALSKYYADLTIYLIRENGRPVVDRVEGRERFRHSYLPKLNSDTRSTLDGYIEGQCRHWERWIAELETWRRTGVRLSAPERR